MTNLQQNEDRVSETRLASHPALPLTSKLADSLESSPTDVSFLLLPVLLVSLLRSHCQIQCREASFSSKSFTVLGFIFKSLIHFVFVFVPALR